MVFPGRPCSNGCLSTSLCLFSVFDRHSKGVLTSSTFSFYSLWSKRIDPCFLSSVGGDLRCRGIGDGSSLEVHLTRLKLVLKSGS